MTWLKTYSLKIPTPMFDHVYCLQPSAADNPWLNKLLVIPWGSEEEYPHLFRNGFPVRRHYCGQFTKRGKRVKRVENLLKCQNSYLDFFELEAEAACEATLPLRHCCSVTHCCGTFRYPHQEQWQSKTTNLWPCATESHSSDCIMWGEIYRS